MTAASSSSTHKYALRAGVVPAPMVPRIVADMADNFVVLPLISLATVQIFGETRSVSGPAVVAALTIFGLYEVFGIAFFGKTIGRKAMGIAVRRNPDGGNVNIGQALLRWLLKTLTPLAWIAAFWHAGADPLETVVSVGQLLVLGSIFLGPWRRGWHDRVSGTIVVEEKSTPRS